MRNTIRKTLQNSRRSSALFDTRRWVQNFEKGLEGVMKIYDSGRPPEDVTVEDADPVVQVEEPQLSLI